MVLPSMPVDNLMHLIPQHITAANILTVKKNQNKNIMHQLKTSYTQNENKMYIRLFLLNLIHIRNNQTKALT